MTADLAAAASALSTVPSAPHKHKQKNKSITGSFLSLHAVAALFFTAGLVCWSPPCCDALLIAGLRDCNSTQPFELPAGTDPTSGITYTVPYYGSVELFRPPTGRRSVSPPYNHSLAIVVVHGTLRNAIDYYCDMISLVATQHDIPSSSVVVIAPHFQEAIDPHTKAELYWNGTNPFGNWRAGCDSDNDRDGVPRIASFAVLDKLVDQLSNTTLFPNMKAIRIAGHSAGGQTVSRYSLVHHNRSRTSGPPVRFVVANPSSYVYVDDRRWAYTCNTTNCTLTGTFEPPSNAAVAACPPYNQWEFGLGAGGFRPPYLDGMNQEAVKQRFPTLDVVYLLGTNDTCNTDYPWMPHCDSHSLDTKCQAMLMGPWRLWRGRQYYASLRLWYGSALRHLKLEVPGVGHDHAAMFGSAQGIKALFTDNPQGGWWGH